MTYVQITMRPHCDTAAVLIGEGYECESVALTADEMENAARELMEAAAKLRQVVASRDRMTNYNQYKHRIPTDPRFEPLMRLVAKKFIAAHEKALAENEKWSWVEGSGTMGERP